jgi:transcriptional regulator with XRE-family HTH domain
MNQKSSLLTAAQIRAARGFLRWSAGDLATKSGVGLSTIQRAEGAEGTPALTRPNMEAVRRALEAAGIRFTEGGGVTPATAAEVQGPDGA